MPIEYLKDGDLEFIGLNSRDNPSALPKGIVSQSQNFRLDRGVATVRKGIQRKTIGALIGQIIYGVGTYINSTGQEIIVLVVTNGLYTYNPDTETLSSKVNFPSGETITTQDGCKVTAGVDLMFISRGFSKRPLRWDLNVTITAFGTSALDKEFPNCESILYYANRFIVAGKHHAEPSTLRNNDTICVSNFLDWQHFDALDAFTINNGGNDRIVGVSPWTLNEFLIFLRNSVFYVSVGTSRYASGDGLSADSYVKTLATDIGCSAKKSIVQANGGVLFLSDNGVYFLQPQQAASAESLKLMTMSDPISAPIDDIIQRINRNYAHRAVATYWNNRYYLAVPIDSSVDNNAVLVFNFILKQWESVDTYPAGFDVFEFVIAKKANQRRMFGVDTDQGIFLMEELSHDEYQDWTSGDPNAGTPILPFYLPSTLMALSFPKNAINSILKTRNYSFGTIGEKRFSTAEVDMLSDAGSKITTSAVVTNPDATTIVDTFGFPTTEDSTRRTPIRKLGTYIQLIFTSFNLRPSIRSAYVYAVQKLKNNQSKK